MGFIAAGIGAVAGGAIAAHGASSAADTQAAAGQKALDLQNQEYQQQRQDLAPWVATGSQANTTLSGLTSTPGQGLLAGYQGFTAPTGVTEQNDPGYQFRAQQGQKAIQGSAAANGTLLNGSTLKDLASYQQGLASQEYGNVYSRALSDWQNNMQNFYTGQNNTFNRLSSVSSQGQNAAAGQANAAGQYGTNAANTITGIGNVQAAGTVGSANAINSGISGASNDLLSGLLMNQLKPNTTSSYWTDPGISNGATLPDPGAYVGQDVNNVANSIKW